MVGVPKIAVLLSTIASQRVSGISRCSRAKGFSTTIRIPRYSARNAAILLRSGEDARAIERAAQEKKVLA